MSCPAANQTTSGTNRELAICTLLSPTTSSGNGQITVTFSGGSDTFTSSATSFTGISGFRTAVTSGIGGRRVVEVDSRVVGPIASTSWMMLFPTTLSLAQPENRHLCVMARIYCGWGAGETR